MNLLSPERGERAELSQTCYFQTLHLSLRPLMTLTFRGRLVTAGSQKEKEGRKEGREKERKKEKRKKEKALICRFCQFPWCKYTPVADFK